MDDQEASRVSVSIEQWRTMRERIAELEAALREVEELLTGAQTMPGNTIRAVTAIRKVRP